MKFMSEYDIDSAARRFAGMKVHPVLAQAVRQIQILQAYADANSDGWAYWRKPAQAAKKLMAMVEGDREADSPRCTDCNVMGSQRHNRFCNRPDATLPELRRALVPVKALRTRLSREGMPWFEVVDA